MLMLTHRVEARERGFSFARIHFFSDDGRSIRGLLPKSFGVWEPGGKAMTLGKWIAAGLVVFALVLLVLFGAGVFSLKRSDDLQAYTSGYGVKYCITLSEVTRTDAWRISGFAIALSVVAGALVLLGGVVGPGPEPKTEDAAERKLGGLIAKNRGVLLS